MSRGRPQKALAEKKDRKITVWMSQKEKDKLLQEIGVTTASEYFRKFLLTHKPPKLPPNVPAINWEKYQELDAHIKTLRNLSLQFQAHTRDEQAQAIALNAWKIMRMVQDYRTTLIALQDARNDSENK